MNYSVIHKEALAIYWGVQTIKPLVALFGESQGIPQMTASGL